MEIDGKRFAPIPSAAIPALRDANGVPSTVRISEPMERDAAARLVNGIEGFLLAKDVAEADIKAAFDSMRIEDTALTGVSAQEQVIAELTRANERLALELRDARGRGADPKLQERLTAAEKERDDTKVALQQKDGEIALLQAEQAETNAQLKQAQSDAEDGKKALQQKDQEIARLQAELSRAKKTDGKEKPK